MEEFLKDLGFRGASEPHEFYWVRPLAQGAEIQALVKSERECHFKLVYNSGYSLYKGLLDKKAAVVAVALMQQDLTISNEARSLSYADYVRAVWEERDYVCALGTIPAASFALPWQQQLARLKGVKGKPKKKRAPLTVAEDRFTRTSW